MTLHTVEVSLTPADTLKLFDALEARVDTEGWHLVQGGSSLRAVEFVIWRDSGDTSTTIRLADDGTWSATTHIALGEKL